MDAYSISGLLNNQISFLYAPAYLSPTHLYGVTFERGVSISYRDRMHLIISGTASINKKGKILYPGNVARQLSRTLTNINAFYRKKCCFGQIILSLLSIFVIRGFFRSRKKDDRPLSQNSNYHSSSTGMSPRLAR